jgi:hypothetical protein
LEDFVVIRDSMRQSAAAYLPPGEPIQAVFGAQTASQYMMALTGVIFFRFVNDFRIVAVTPQRIVVLDAGKSSIKKAKGIVMELPRATRLGPGSGVWQVIPAPTC